MIYVGIDVAKDKHDCFITNSNGEVLFKSSYHGQDVVLATSKAIKKSNPLGFPVLVPILSQFWCRLQML
jgi:transposase